MPLDDGTNKEREDICVPLPFQKKSELNRIVFYGALASPACCKTRALLHLAGIVTYERIYGPPLRASYQKVPVLVINDKYQINDSHIIFKNLAPILYPGYECSDKDLELP